MYEKERTGKNESEKTYKNDEYKWKRNVVTRTNKEDKTKEKYTNEKGRRI